jgi:hypothetical protein
VEFRRQERQTSVRHALERTGRNSGGNDAFETVEFRRQERQTSVRHALERTERNSGGNDAFETVEFRRQRRHASVPCALVLLLCAAAIQPARGQTAWFEGFEGPNPSWFAIGGDARYVVQDHQRVAGAAHSGRGCEWFQIAAQAGNSIYIGHDVGRPWVIEDLRPSVWVRSDRGGLQFLAEITLPRTIDPRTGRALVTYLLGSSYTDVGRWQQLRIDDSQRLLTRQLHILRSQLAVNVDGRQAIMSRAVLNIYGGPGVSNVWIDDLAVGGHVPSQEASTGKAAARPEVPSPLPPGGGTSGGPPEREVKLAGSVLLVNGNPIFPRAVQYQGERLTTLRQLGFNTIWMRQPPPVEILNEARRLGLWLVCPPPRSADGLPLPPIGPEFEPVMAWDLGSGLGREQLDATRQWAEAIRMADARRRRPLICCPACQLRQYSRQVNLLLADRRPLGTSLEMPDYGVWLRRQPLLAVPGTPLWTTIQTQPGSGPRRQLAGLDPSRPPPTTVAPEQIRLLVYTAISSGSRGMLFLSQSPLDAPDAESRQRAMTLQLINQELDVIEPWVAAGTLVALAESSQRLVSGAVLRSDRARIVLPVWLAPGSQCVAPAAAANSLAVIVPGAPESSIAYELTSGRLEPLRRKRDTGGIRLMIDEFGLSALLFLAQDPLVVEAVTHRAAAGGRIGAELERHLAARKLETTSQVVDALARRMPAGVKIAELLADARRSLQLCDRELSGGDFIGTSLEARRAMRPLRQIERAFWDAAMKGQSSPTASPGTTSFVTLPWHWALVDRLAAGAPGPNLLPGGDFEDFNTMLKSGWRHVEHATDGVQTAADLVVEAAHGGHWGLRLTARPDDPEHPPAMLEMPPVWITSPAVPVEAGQLLVIHGWVNIPAGITGSVDGLLVIDSLSGEDLAQRIDRTAGWREFTVFRMADQPGPMTVTFALSGLGEARLDDISIQVIEPRRPQGR